MVWMAIKIIIVGANVANAEEIKNVVLATLGDSSEITTATIENFKQFDAGDLYVCLVNRRQEIEKVVGADKIVGIELLPPTDYFIAISRIPANNTVIVFNNSTNGTKVLMDCLKRYNLMHVHYQVVPYDEWSEQQVAEKISTARYITGSSTYVDQGRPLQTRFRNYLARDVVIIASPQRIATSDSISLLTRTYFSLAHQQKMAEQKQNEATLIKERDTLKSLVAQVQRATAQMTATAAEILSTYTQVATITKDQAAAVSAITTTIQEIKFSADQVTRRAQSVAQSSDRAAVAAQHGIDAVGAAIAGMDEIQEKVEQLAVTILALSEQTHQAGNIVDTVTDIAGQSNILALNAAIEAAHAGELGKRFRVVADEVRNFAEQSRQAAKQVKLILETIQKSADLSVAATKQSTQDVVAGSGLVSKTSQTINELAQVVNAAAQSAEQIVAGVQEQTIGLDKIVTRMNEINQAAQQSANGAQRSRQAAENLNQVAEQLKAMVDRYTL
jgi:methyl-accepting chemotaxis protein